MLVLIPRLLNKLISYLQRLTKLSPSLTIASKIASVVVLFAIIPALNVGFQKQSYQTKVKFTPDSSAVLSLPDRSQNVARVRSREELKDLGLNHDPQAIADLIQELAPQYGVDWRLVYAIGYLESGNFNSSLARNQNNFFGRKVSSGVYASWSSPEEAIRNQFEYLKTRYIDRGMDSPYEMNRVYAESGTWGAKVTAIMGSL